MAVSFSSNPEALFLLMMISYWLLIKVAIELYSLTVKMANNLPHIYGQRNGEFNEPTEIAYNNGTV